jgi:hypothetical protein
LANMAVFSPQKPRTHSKYPDYSRKQKPKDS